MNQTSLSVCEEQMSGECLENNRIDIPKKGRLTKAGVGVEDPCGWTLSQKTQYDFSSLRAEGLCVIEVPTGADMNVTNTGQYS